VIRGKTFISFFENEPNNIRSQANMFILNKEVQQGFYGLINDSIDEDWISLYTPHTKIDDLITFRLFIPADQMKQARQVKLILIGDTVNEKQGSLLFEPSTSANFLKPSMDFSSWIQVGTLVFEPPASGEYYLKIIDDFSETGDYFLLKNGGDPSNFSDIVQMVFGGMKRLFQSVI